MSIQAATEESARVRYQRIALHHRCRDLGYVEGRRLLAAALRNPPEWLQGERLERALLWPRNMGPSYARRVLQDADCVGGRQPSHRIGDLTERQRERLARALEARG